MRFWHNIPICSKVWVLACAILFLNDRMKAALLIRTLHHHHVVLSHYAVRCLPQGPRIRICDRHVAGLFPRTIWEYLDQHI